LFDIAGFLGERWSEWTRVTASIERAADRLGSAGAVQRKG
jgi:hypothetical protein